MRVAIVGAGAVGLGLGATLYRGGTPLRILVRDPRTRRGLKSVGLVRRGLFGDVHVPKEAIRIDTDLASLAEDPVDVVLVCTKTTASLEVAHHFLAAGLSGRNGPDIVLCQNGWGNAEIFSEKIPEERIFNARIITGFHRKSPTEVEVTAHAQPISMGSLFGFDSSRLGPLCLSLSRGGIESQLSADIGSDLWAKMLYNCALNPLGALLDLSYGELARLPGPRLVLEAVVCEIFAVLEASGRTTPWDDAAAYLEVFYRDLLPPTRQHQSSMLQDIRAARRTEIDALCGEIVRLGSQENVETPVNAALKTLIEARHPSGR